MAILQDPITQRDFSAGRIAKTTVSTALMPNYSSHTLTSAVNSVSNSINVDFSEIIGSGVVRKGKQHIVQIGAVGRTDQTFATPNSGDQQPVYSTNWLAQTFTPSVSGIIVGITLQLYLVGSVEGYATMRIQGVSGGLPNGVNVLEPVVFDLSQISQTSYPGGLYTFYFIGSDQFTVAGTPLAIVLSYPLGDGSDNLEWIRNAAGSISGGQASHSTDGGSTWSTITGAFVFTEKIIDTGTPYNHKPLGNFSWLNAGVGKNVVAFDEPISNTGVIFYWNSSANFFPNWQSSTLNYLSNTLVRFANMNGSVFEVNGVQPMHDSADFGATWGTTNSITANSVIPSLIIVSGNRMLASGYSAFLSRVYFSSLVDPNGAMGVFLTWNTDPTSGDFIDIDPDSGGVVTGFANVSSMTLVFKNNGMYRLNTIAKSVDAENIFNVGAVSQEAITTCLGLCYFYSGKGIYSTDSTFPTQISRIAVQDFVDAIADPNQVFSWSDEFNVYFSIGNVTIQFGPEDFRTYTNVVLKFSPRDQNWQVMSYNQYLAQTSTFGPLPTFGNPIQGEILPGLLATEYDGYISWVNNETISDDGQAIPYNLETQELELGDRSHVKQLSDKMVVYARNGNESSISVKENDGDFKSANMTMENRVNVGTSLDFTGNFFTVKWKGEALGSRPIFEGFHFPTVTDLGIIQNDNK